MFNFLPKINEYYNNQKKNNDKVLNDLYNNPNTQDLDLEKNLDNSNNVLKTSINDTTNPIYDTETKGGLEKPKEEPKENPKENPKETIDKPKVETKVEINPTVDKKALKTEDSKENTTAKATEEPKIDKIGDSNVEITPEYQSMVSNSLPDKDKPTLKSKILHKLGRMAMGGLKGAAYSMANMQDTGKMVGNIYVPSHSFGSGGLNAVRQDIQNETTNQQNQQRLDIAKEKIESDTVNNINTNEAKAKQQAITNKINQQNADTQQRYAEARANDLKHTIQKENKQEFENKNDLLNSINTIDVNTDQQNQLIDNMKKSKSLYGAGTLNDINRNLNNLASTERNQALANVKAVLQGLVANNIRQSDIGDRGVLSEGDREIFESSLNDPNADFETNINLYNNFAKRFNGRILSKAKLAGLSNEEMKNIRQIPVININSLLANMKENK